MMNGSKLLFRNEKRSALPCLTTWAGTNVCSSGRKFDSLSCHAFLIGCNSKKIINYDIKLKACAKCDAIKKRKLFEDSVKNKGTGNDNHVEVTHDYIDDGDNKNNTNDEIEDVSENEDEINDDDNDTFDEIYENLPICPFTCSDCVKNYEASSKAMEADTALEMVCKIHKFFGGSVYIKEIVADDDSTMRSLLKHKSKENKDGNLPKDIHEPKWLANLTHHCKVVAKEIYTLAKQAKALSLVMKLEAIRIKKYYGYCIKQTRNLPFEEMYLRRYAPLEHMFDNHEHCDSSWCHKKRSMEKDKEIGKSRNDGKNDDNVKNKKGYYRSINNEIDLMIYQQIKEHYI